MTSLGISDQFIKTLNGLHPKHQGQVAVELVRLAAGEARSDWKPLKGRGSMRVTVGEYRVEITRNRAGLCARALYKRNDGYKP